MQNVRARLISAHFRETDMVYDSANRSKARTDKSVFITTW